MKLWLQALGMCQSMFCAIPSPWQGWEEKAREKMLLCLPLVGLEIGLLWWGLGLLCRYLPPLMAGAVLAGWPWLATGFLHLDGFMDTTDARSSYGDREKKLAILKDSHVGAFAVIGCSFYLILSAGAWSEIDAKGIVVMAMAFVLERAFSGLAAVNFKGARKDGMLTAFREPARKRTVTVVLAAEAVISAIVMCYLWLPVGLLCSLGAVLTFVYYYKMAMKEFGGTTGDLAGWFLQTCELVMLMLTVVGKIILA